MGWSISFDLGVQSRGETGFLVKLETVIVHSIEDSGGRLLARIAYECNNLEYKSKLDTSGVYLFVALVCRID
jgi:hypothetical protein